MADLSQAYQRLAQPIHKFQTIDYLHQCIHCGSNNVLTITNDGGSIQMCNNCGKSYRARMTTPNLSTGWIERNMIYDN